MLKLVVVLAFVAITCAGEDKKWVWDGNSRANKLQNDPGTNTLRASPRYEIFEPDYDYNRPPPRPIGPQGPINNYPNRPGGDYGRPGYYPNTDIHGRPPVKQFDSCSCTEKFNCQSPGISYGHCDVGKSYCCFNRHGGLELGPAPSRPIQSPANGILVGPSNGGDIGYGSSGYNEPFNRPNYGRPYPPVRPGYGGGPQGVLVGPGGPTGIIGRPGYGRPINSASNGILVGPGGPYDRPVYGGGYKRPFSIFGRSAGKASDTLADDDKTDDKKS